MNTQLKSNLNQMIKAQFPSSLIYSSFAYGSAVIPQRDNKGRMIDLIFIVEDLKTFHKENLKMNKSHYSKLSRMLNNIEQINKMGTGVYFNQGVSLNENTLVKYGVVGLSDFQTRLTRWTDFFIAGRFHKPVMSLDDTMNKELDDIICRNRSQAFALAALQNETNVSKRDLLIDIANLSYLGDIRSYLRAEKRNKVASVVEGGYGLYEEIYDPIARQLGVEMTNDKYVIPENSLKTLLRTIPAAFVIKMQNGFSDKEFENIFINKYQHVERRKEISDILKKVNLTYSIYGILSGFISSDIHKSVKLIPHFS